MTTLQKTLQIAGLTPAVVLTAALLASPAVADEGNTRPNLRDRIAQVQENVKQATHNAREQAQYRRWNRVYLREHRFDIYFDPFNPVLVDLPISYNPATQRYENQWNCGENKYYGTAC